MEVAATPQTRATSAQMISVIEPDWSRERKPPFRWGPGKSLLASLRSYERWRSSKNPIARIPRILAVLRHRFWSAIAGADIPLGARIGGGLLIPHPNGIVIHSAAAAGLNCLIVQQVTLGVGPTRAPIIGGHVDIGAGAKVLGDISVGDHARIGANAVVLIDVPSNSTAVGIPARIRNLRG
jgi:serine O-acetyltransferase